MGQIGFISKRAKALKEGTLADTLPSMTDNSIFSGPPRRVPLTMATPTLNTPPVTPIVVPQAPAAPTRFIAPKGMGFSQAFKKARMEGQKEFDWYDPKTGQYRPIKVELAGSSGRTTPRSTSSGTPSAAPAAGMPPVPQKVDTKVGNMIYPAQNENYADFVIRVNKEYNEKYGLSTAQNMTPNVKPVSTKATSGKGQYAYHKNSVITRMAK